MKISNWCRKVALSLVAAGCVNPAVMAAVNIPLGDPGFEDYQIPTVGVAAGLQYAYAIDTRANKFDYRPTSAWISRIDDNIAGQDFHQDGGKDASNWIYTSAYAELVVSNPEGGASNPGGIAAGKRPAPRTGTQAMHGRGHFNGQEIPSSTAVFEVGKLYTFSIYAQGDSNAEIFSTGWQSRAYLFLYDATIPFRNPAVSPYDAYNDPEAFQALTYDSSLYDESSQNYTYFPPDRFAPDEPTPPENTVIHPGQFINRPAAATAAQSKAAWQKISLNWLVLPGAAEIGHPMGVAFRLIDDGAVDDAALTVSGEGTGDLNLDGSLNAADWNTFKGTQLTDLSALSIDERYLAGDLNMDGFNNHADFVIFKNEFESTNGPGSFVAMLSAVPEPTTTFLISTAGIFLTLVRKRR